MQRNNGYAIEMKTYIQSDVKGEGNRDIVEHGMKALNVPYCFCSRYHKLDNLCKTNVFYGGVGFIQSISEQYGYKYTPIGEVPEDMLSYSGRNIFECTLQKAMEISEREPLFIKPTSDKNKGFQGVIIGKKREKTDTYDPHTYLTEYYLRPTDKVIASTVVEFVSEWRCFVYNGKVGEAVHYKGDKTINPHCKKIEFMVESWRKPLIAYALDVGITKSGQTLVVECNDLPSLGLYGVGHRVFGEMLIKRWYEIHERKGFDWK